MAPPSCSRPPSPIICSSCTTASRRRSTLSGRSAPPSCTHRERGLLLDEPDVTVDGAPIPASLLGTALTLFHAGRAQAERGQGIYFYLPKLESAEETAFWRAFFDASRERLSFLKDAV